MKRRDFLQAIFALSAGAVVVGPASGMAALLRRPGQLPAPNKPPRAYPIWPEVEEEWTWIEPGQSGFQCSPNPPRHPDNGWWLYATTSTLPSPRGPLVYIAAEYTDVGCDGDPREVAELRMLTRRALARRIRLFRRGKYD